MLQRGNVSAAVDTLEKKGYLIRYTDSDDKRIVHLKLTEQTDDIVHAIEEKQEALVSCIFAGFSEDEKKNFAAYNELLYQKCNVTFEITEKLSSIVEMRKRNETTK